MTEKAKISGYILIYVLSEIIKGNVEYMNVNHNSFQNIKINIVNTIKAFS